MESKEVEKTLGEKTGVHQEWKDSYRTKENEKYYEQAFDYITRFIARKNGTQILEVGCGTGNHTIRLAKRGFSVMAVDFSEYALEIANEDIMDSGLSDYVILKHENILSLSFDDEAFDCIICWGVLMHIPDIDKAISELDRVLKNRGTLIISEVNMFSLQSLIVRSLKKFKRAGHTTIKKTPAGIENWRLTSTGKLLTREANINWLNRQFTSKGYLVKKHVSGQFTELYTKISFKLIRKLIHYFNYLWFRYVKVPLIAFGNIIILEKKKKEKNI